MPILARYHAPLDRPLHETRQVCRLVLPSGKRPLNAPGRLRTPT
jgi:hypothetical protein